MFILNLTIRIKINQPHGDNVSLFQNNIIREGKNFKY